MHGRIADRLFIPFLLLANANAVQAACLDPAQLAHSTVSITRHFDGTDAHRDIVGVQGTGWFLSPTTIVTAEHVTKGMELLSEDWKALEIVGGDGSSQLVGARIQRIAGAQAEKLAVIELQRAVPAARSAVVRREPLVPEEQVITLSYPADRLHSVQGRFVRFGENGTLAGLALLEVFEGNNRLVIDHGASGAPVFDCDGRVAAVISHVFTQSIRWASREIRVSTAWGWPNVVSVPIQSLEAARRID